MTENNAVIISLSPRRSNEIENKLQTKQFDFVLV